MVGTKLKMRMDENATEKYNPITFKKDKPLTEITTKRAALGDLQNRAVVRTVAAKDAAQKDLKDAKTQATLRNTKARVDTFWKKAPLGTSNANNIVAAGVAAAKPASMLLRSNSVRMGTAAGLQRQASTNVPPTKTLTNAKVVEMKSVAAEKQKLKSGEDNNKNSAVVDATTTLRREDSNLSRKSLTKLRAAMTRDTAAVAKPLAAKNQNNAIAAAAIRKDVLPKSLPLVKPVQQQQPQQQQRAKSSELKVGVTKIGHSSKRFEGVEDIDAEDADNLVLVSEYVNDIYDYLYKVEADQRVVRHHLDGQEEVNSKMRSVLIDWINEVHFQFHLAAETFHMAVAIVDRYLQAVKDTKRLHLQLVGVTALFIATKYEELFPPAISDFVYITDDTYTAKQIRLMELQIFKSLDYNLARPLPIHFLRRYSKAAGAEDAHHAMSKYFLELASIEYELAHYKPSEIAAASLFLSLHLLNGNAKAATGFNNRHWTATLEYYSRYNADHLRPITKIIATVARNAPHAKLKAVYTKYQSTKFQKISLRAEIYGALMDSIVNAK